MTPFQALYGFPPPIHIPYFPKDSNVAVVDIYTRDREATIALLKHHLNKAANRMKQMADKRRTERQFQVRDMVFLIL